MFKYPIAAAMAAQAAASQWKGGEFKTKETFKYGKFRARIQSDNKLGTIASLFLFWDCQNIEERQKGWNEIDVEIVPSITKHPYSTNIIWENKTMDQEYVDPFIPGTDWHIYEIHWTPDYVSWAVDNKIVRKVENTPAVRFLTKEQHLVMDYWIAANGAWADGFNSAGMPWYAKYDWVETYKYTGGNEFELHWRDDFNQFDETRWAKSDGWGSPGGATAYKAEQVYVKDGELYLKLEPNSWKTETETEPEEFLS